MDTEKQFWQGQGFWNRCFGGMTPLGKVWFWSLLALMIFGGFYIGFWISCHRDYPLDVPYVTADSYVESKEQALAAAKNYLGDDGKLAIMLLGCDVRTNDVGRSDTLMVAFVDLDTPAIDLLSIPRDTYVQLADGKGKTKINAAFAYGGVSLTKKTVESFLNLEIDRYAQIDFNGFAAIVDALGGITYNVEERMYRPSDDIDLQPGEQVLDGKNALAYVRWRGTPTADIGRIGRQQEFMTAVADKLLNVGSIFKLPKLMGIINDNVETDMTNKEILTLVDVFKGATSNEMRTEMVPGIPQTLSGVSYWVPDDAKLQSVIMELQADLPPAADTTNTDANTTAN